MDSHFYVLPCIYTVLVLSFVVLNQRSIAKRRIVPQIHGLHVHHEALCHRVNQVCCLRRVQLRHKRERVYGPHSHDVAF